MNKRLLIVFLLGFSSGIPFALISSTLQAWFASVGMSVMMTGMLSLLSFPYVYRMVWAPFTDRYTLWAIGRRRSWILAMQLLLLVGFNGLAWFAPETHPYLMIGAAFILACLSATQDIVIDAQRTEYLLPPEQGLGASFAMFGYRLALLMSGGVILIVAAHYGWANAYRLGGLFMIPGMIAILWSKEPSEHQTDKKGLKALFVEPLAELLSRNQILASFIFIFLYKLGEAFTTITSGIVMPFLIQGIGFSLETIAYVNKILGVIAVVVGGFVAAILLVRWSLYRALVVFGLLQAFTNVLFVALAVVGQNVVLLSCAVISDNFAAGMGSTALVVLFMRMVDKRFTATQFSVLVAFSTLPRILSGPFAAWLQAQFGWVGLYELSVLFALAFLPFLILMQREHTFRAYLLKEPI